jgi:hypothetical protein
MAFLPLALLASAQAPLPDLRTEPTGGGSIFFVKNVSAQPLTGYLIELVNYPGSYYALWQDEAGKEPLAPGGEKRIQVTNMTVGAVPDYVKLQAAVYADGSSSGVPEKVTMLIERRRFVLATVRELLGRLEKAEPGAAGKSALTAALKQWSDSMQPPGKSSRTQAAVNQAAGRALILDTSARLESGSVDDTLAQLRAYEKALAASKPTL